MGCYGMSQLINVVLSLIINIYCLPAATDFNAVISARCNCFMSSLKQAVYNSNSICRWPANKQFIKNTFAMSNRVCYKIQTIFCF